MSAPDLLDPYDLDAGTREHYQDAALYDFEYRRRRADVNHYRRVARSAVGAGAWILELGCGTGRVLCPLARDGHIVVGLDAAGPMLARARDRVAALGRAAAARAHLVQADMRRFALARRFALVLTPFNAVQHLYTHLDVTAFLRGVREHLEPGGWFAFDVLNPDLKWLTRDARKRWARTRFTHPITGRRWEYSTNQTYDPVSQIAYVRLYYAPLDEKGEPLPSERTLVVRLAQRMFFPAELEGILEANGFLVEERWGGFDREPFEGDSESQVLLCRVR